ncbi:hypothetical protein ASD24_24580 [Paenibacillus sp. Root52]|uniref:hypothetical protein n=1 Tax=Paenibacillus sp. Root52 TaxID=1736552 RepID=UPI0006F6041C|nr:hypothetical protein [Paenibacillus sp. Root52]KQY90976.1 hypothetical protein ASD24_24580 [Paenibacillus sp. Root52]
MGKIEFKINNKRTMGIVQHKYDETCKVSTYNNTTGEVDHEEEICPGDMVMLLNYYRHVKSNNIECEFINPYPK